MHFVTFSEKELTQTSKYTDFSEPHLLISITNPNHKVIIPKSHYCKQILHLQFLDVEDIGNDSFNYDIAHGLLDFVDAHISTASAIVVHCGAGVSRSVAVASALSKIINHTDDNIFSYGIPNMLTYITILDAYFMDKHIDNRWSSIYYHRDKNLKNRLDANVNRLREYNVKKRKLEKGEL